MRRVVITGMGIWSSIGQDLDTVTESLKQGRSGIIYDPSRIEYGMQSGLVGNVPRPDLKPFLPRKNRVTMSEDAEYAYMAARQAFEQAGIDDEYLRQNEVGIIFGNDGNSHQHEYGKIMDEEHCSALVGYDALFRSLSSSAVVNLGAIFHLKGIRVNIGAACASSSQAVGIASMYIKQGLQDMILVGGSQAITKENTQFVVLDSLIKDTIYNATPSLASRPFDQNAIGCIPSGGAAALILEEYDHAIARRAPIFAEIIGYGFAGGTENEVYNVKWENDYRSIKRALDVSEGITIKDIDYINICANAMPVCDLAVAHMLQTMAKSGNFAIGATESMTGHEAFMSGASCVIYSILMMLNGFVAPNINITHVIKEAEGLNIPREIVYRPLRKILVNSGGIGETYSTLIISNVKQ